MEEPEKGPPPEDCPCAKEGGPVCRGCVERMRAAGVPERTLEWMQQGKEDRIRTVMF